MSIRPVLTRPVLAMAVPLLLLGLVGLTGCSTSDAETDPGPDGGSEQPVAPESPAGIAWEISGGGDYVQGVNLLCDLSSTILLEDLEQTNQFTGDSVVTSMTFFEGRFMYSTIWPDDIVGTGVSGGEGVYEFELDAEGLPTALVGDGTVIWHDADSDEYSERPDTVTIELTAVEAPAYCQQ